MITEQDLTRFKKVFITKKASEAFAKKYDLKNYVIKEDHEADVAMLVANMATKDDMTELEIRLNEQLRNELAAHIAPLIASNKTLIKRQDDLDQKFNHMMNTIDGLAVPIARLLEENSVSAAQYSRQIDWNNKVGAKVGIPFEY